MNELFTKTNSMAIKAVLANAYQKILEIKKVDFEGKWIFPINKFIEKILY